MMWIHRIKYPICGVFSNTRLEEVHSLKFNTRKAKAHKRGKYRPARVHGRDEKGYTAAC